MASDSDSQTTSNTSDSEDDNDGTTPLWCRITQRHHGELVGWQLRKCPSCDQKLIRPKTQPMPISVSRTQLDQSANTAVSVDGTLHVPPRPQYGYSNRFLWKNGTTAFSEPWVVHSKRVMDVFQSLISYYPRIELEGTSLLVCQPYALFYHYYDDITDFQHTFDGNGKSQEGNRNPDPAANACTSQHATKTRTRTSASYAR